MGNLHNVFNPRSIALIGASDREGAIGRTMFTNLLQTKGRKVFPVNPRKRSLLGLQCFESIASIPASVDLAVIATPAKEVPGLVEECGRAGVGGLVIISAGFREAGEEGRLLEQQVAATRRQYGMRILGPNSLGFVRPNVGVNVTFMKTSPPPGDIAFISQSGALGGVILDWATDVHVGFSMFASLGTTIDVNFGDLIDFLGDDDDTRSILLYMERLGDARKFISAARAFAMRKPIVVLRPGRLVGATKTTRSHTGAMADEDAIYEAAFRRVGVVRVREIADLFDAAKVLDSRKLPTGPKLAIVTSAGGQGLMAANALLNIGGELARLSEASMERLNRFSPPFWRKGNPIDLPADADASRYAEATGICLADPGADGVLVIYVPVDAALPDAVARAVVDTAKKAHKPTIAAWMGTKEVRAAREILTENNIPTNATPEQAVKTYANMYRYKRNLELLYETPAELPVQETPPKEHLRELIAKAIGEGRALLNEEESKTFLSSYGIPKVTPHITRHSGEATAIAREVGYPVAIKIVSPDVLDRSDVGGVVMWIESDEQLMQAYEGMLARVKERAPQIRIEGVSIQKMIEDIDYELILGCKKHKDFGTVILFGMGGVTTELIRDFSVGLPPLNQTLARRLMEETKAYKLIQGWHGKPPADLGELETTLVNFSNLVVDFPEIAEIDINPLAISEGKPCALYARIILDEEYIKSPHPYPHLVITPYPTRYVVPWKAPDGTEVLLRPFRPEDEPVEREFVTSLSAETLRTRFFSVFRSISHDWLVSYCNIDYDRHIAIVAEIKEEEKRRIIGVARLVVQPDLNSGQYAVVVHDNSQRRGLGRKLMEILIRIGRDKGLDEIYGEVLPDNEKMLGLCRDLDFTMGLPSQGMIRVSLKLK
jgi:acetyltransferase